MEATVEVVEKKKRVRKPKEESSEPKRSAGTPSPYGLGTETGTLRVPVKDREQIRMTLAAIKKSSAPDVLLEKWLEIGQILAGHGDSGAKATMLVEVAKRLTA